MARAPWEADEIVGGGNPWEQDEVLAPAAASSPPRKTGLKEGLKEAVRSLVPSRVEYGEKHPGKNTIKGQMLGDDADPTFMGTVGAYAEDLTSLPARLSRAYGAKAAADLKAFPGRAKPEEAYDAVKREMQKTEGDGFLETAEREMPLMMIPGGGGRSAASLTAKAGGEAVRGLPKLAESGALPLKDWITAEAEKIPAKAAEVAQAVPGMATKALGGLKRLGGDLARRMGHSAVETAPQAAYHQLQSYQDNGEAAPGQATLEVGLGGASAVPMKVLGGTARLLPQGAKWLMSQVSGANQKALQRVSEKGGVDALKKVAGENAADNLADEIITSLGRKEDLLHPEPKEAAKIIPKLPPVEAVEPMTRRNTVAYADGKEIPMEFNRPLEPIPTGASKPSLKEMDEYAAAARAGGDEGLPGGNEKYEAASRRFRIDAAERTRQSAVVGQTVKQALRGLGKPIYVSDSMRSQMGLSGSRWKGSAAEFGLDMFTSDKSKGISLDKAATMIGAEQSGGRWAGLPKIESEGDLMDALYESTAGKPAGKSDMDKFLQEAIKTGENLEKPEIMPAGALKRGDIFTVGGTQFKVLKNADGQVIIDGPVKHILDARERVHFDPGTRIGNDGEVFSAPAVGESMDIPEQGKVVFLKTLTEGRERFRDLLEQKTGETVRTPEKKKTIGKLSDLLDLADEQLQGSETLSAQEALNFKRDYQDVLQEQYKSRDSDEYFNTYKKLAHSLRTGIEEAAERSGNQEYIGVMRSLATKMQAIERVETRFVGDQITKAQDRAARQIKIINNDAQRPALKELQVLDKLFGTNFAERAQDIGFAKMLNMTEQGVPILPITMTGRALLGVGAGANIYNAGEGHYNPLAIAGLLLSSPRLAMYAFKALDRGGPLAARIGQAGKKLGPSLPRLQSSLIHSNRDKETAP